jgi:predicted nucleic acid-binding protein
MKICFDSNVVLDILSNNDQCFASLTAYDVSVINKDEQYVPMFTTSDIYYILRHSYTLRKDTAVKALTTLFELFELLDGHPLDCKQALESEMSDYEDALIAFAAQRQGVDFIITRNKKDFAASPVPALTPTEFIELFKPKTITYAQFDDIKGGGATVPPDEATASSKNELTGGAMAPSPFNIIPNS